MSIVTLPEAKDQLNIDLNDSSQDSQLLVYLDAVTGAVENVKGEVVEARQVVDEFTLSGASEVLLRSVPVISLTNVQTVDGATTWNTADLHVNTRTGKVIVLSGPALSGLVQFTYQAGYTTVPDNYVLGALVMLQYLWGTQRGVGDVPGAVDVDEAAALAASRLPQARLLLGSHLPGVA